MGRLVEVDAGIVLPTQNFLKPGTVRHILGLLAAGRFEDLPPEPIVRKHGDSLLALDGHNKLAVFASRDEPVQVYIADYAQDALPGSDAAIQQRNKDLAERFALAVQMHKQAGIATISDLVAANQSLFNE